MKCCELCKHPARIYCESDLASLCWECDAKVHSANFLVARHSRTLLCRVCQSPTAWNASGEKLGRTVSVCERCVDGCDGTKAEESEGGNDDEIDSEDDEDDEPDMDDEDGDNQVVPWSSTPSSPSASSSSSEQSSSRFSRDRDVSSKRKREIDRSDDDQRCSSSQPTNQTPMPATRLISVDSLSLRPLKTRKAEANRSGGVQITGAGSGSHGIPESFEMFL